MSTTTLAAAALALTLTAAGCAADTSTAHEGSSGPTASQHHGADAIEVTVADGAVQPAPTTYDVHLGDQVTIEVTSDVAEEVHVHGYDRSVDLEAGAPGTMTFTADIPGVFEAELEGTGLELLELKVE